MKAFDVCANHYMQRENVTSIAQVAAIVNNKHRNERRGEKRRSGEARDRGQDNSQRRRSREEARSLPNCINNYNFHMSQMFLIPCVVCESHFTTGISKISDDILTQLEQMDDRKKRNLYSDGLWICLTCEKVNQKLAGEENIVTVVESFLDLNPEVGDTVGITRYQIGDEMQTCLFPIIREDIQAECSWLTIPDKDVTCLCPSTFFNLPGGEEVEAEWAQLVTNQLDVEQTQLLSLIYRDAHQRMKAAKKQTLKQHESCRLGYVSGQVLHTKNEAEPEPDFALKDIRGTDPYNKKIAKENKAKQLINGKRNFYLNKLVYTPGAVNSKHFAKVMLENNGIPVFVDVNQQENGYETRDYIVPCHLPTGLWCTVNDCGSNHFQALEEVLANHQDDGKSESNAQVSARYLKESVDNFVYKLLEKQCKDFDLRLVFQRCGKVRLAGNVWLRELDNNNLNGLQEVDMDSISELFKSDFTNCNWVLLDEIRDWEEQEQTITEETQRSIDSEPLEGLREVSVVEMVYNYSRGLKNHWTSQSVVKLDIRDQSEVKVQG